MGCIGIVSKLINAFLNTIPFEVYREHFLEVLEKDESSFGKRRVFLPKNTPLLFGEHGCSLGRPARSLSDLA